MVNKRDLSNVTPQLKEHKLSKNRNFYSKLSKALTDSNRRGIKIVMGDLNSKVGIQNEGLEHVKGRHGTN
jgi:hypothetical protein